MLDAVNSEDCLALNVDNESIQTDFIIVIIIIIIIISGWSLCSSCCALCVYQNAFSYWRRRRAHTSVAARPSNLPRKNHISSTNRPTKKEYVSLSLSLARWATKRNCRPVPTDDCRRLRRTDDRAVALNDRHIHRESRRQSDLERDCEQ